MSVMKKLKRAIIIILAGILTVSVSVPAFAAEETTTEDQTKSSVTEIYDYNDLLKISENPSGAYKLMADIDLKDVLWTPLDFSGTLDGNGYAVLNATVNQTTSDTRKIYDGNLIAYDTYFAGFFGILENATVKNLKFLGLKVNIDTDKVCFAGGFTGFMENSDIENCTIEGEIRLATSGKSFGVGGMAGFGNGSIKNSSSDMTLVCIDKDAENKDEQFMGGAYAAGYIDLDRNTVKIQGYDSDHGYVHNGGLIGMYVLYPMDEGYRGYVTNNNVSGKITFFEDNEDRRAYCEPVAGEIMNWTFDMDGNDSDFTRDEIFDYSTDLLPHSCTAQDYENVVTPATCTAYGYTTMKCRSCGEYSYKTEYTPLAHEISEWNKSADSTDSEQGSCSKCGALVYRKVSQADNTAQQQPAATDKKTEKSSGKGAKTAILIIVVIIVIAAALYIISKKNREKKMRQRAAARRAAMAGRSQSYDRARAMKNAARGNVPRYGSGHPEAPRRGNDHAEARRYGSSHPEAPRRGNDHAEPRRHGSGPQGSRRRENDQQDARRRGR